MATSCQWAKWSPVRGREGGCYHTPTKDRGGGQVAGAGGLFYVNTVIFCQRDWYCFLQVNTAVWVWQPSWQNVILLSQKHHRGGFVYQVTVSGLYFILWGRSEWNLIHSDLASECQDLMGTKVGNSFPFCFNLHAGNDPRNLVITFFHKLASVLRFHPSIQRNISLNNPAKNCLVVFFSHEMIPVYCLWFYGKYPRVTTSGPLLFVLWRGLRWHWL